MTTGREQVKLLETATPSRDLLRRARDGDDRALNSLFRRNRHALLRWARGRLPRWARGLTDTTDIVQDVLLQTFRRIDVFEDRGKGALQAYLRRAVDNRIADEVRKISRHPIEELNDLVAELPSRGPAPDQVAAANQEDARYKRALATLTKSEQRLVVGRLELGYNYEQLAAICNRPNSEAARIAVRRAVIKLAQRLAGG